jgi:hypothetical protein
MREYICAGKPVAFVGVMSSIRLHFPAIHMTNAVRHATSKKRLCWHPWCRPANLLPLFLAALINLFLFTSFVFYGELTDGASDTRFRLLILPYSRLSSYCVCCKISKDQELIKLWGRWYKFFVLSRVQGKQKV